MTLPIRNSQFAIRNFSQGFTLVELLVVIGIIAVLAGVLFGTLNGSGDSARTAQCLANMKNLANACQTYAMACGHYPLAGNKVYLSIDESRGARNIQKKYTEVPGWISTMTRGFFPGTSYKQGQPVSMYTSDDEAAQYALTNGVLWKYVSGNHNTYLCPDHVRKMSRGGGLPPRWSYLMSARFGWDSAGRPSTGTSGRIEYNTLARADRILLFSEIPFCGYNTWNPEGDGGGTDTDAILQYSSSGASSGAAGANSGSGGNEEIGVNHRVGKNCFANVAYADGHCEKLRIPMANGKPDASQMKQLATWFATGEDVSFDGKKFQKLDN